MPTHYKGTGKVSSFRGLLVNDDIPERIHIQGSVGAIAWRITKFQVMGINEDKNYETVVQINRKEITPSDSVNFADNDLLGAALYGDTDSIDQATSSVIFDREIFNQDIFISAKATAGTSAINYYIELEEVKVSAAGMGQLAVAAARRTLN